MFKSWNWALGPRVDVTGIEVQHRESFASMSDLVDAAYEQLRPRLRGRYAFFGHSFGALLAYRLACRALELNAELPRLLVLSSYAPPHLPPPVPDIEHLDNDQLARLLTELGGMPPESMLLPALRDMALDAARIDLRLCLTDDDTDPVVLPCPIHAFGGLNDPLVEESELEEWETRTSSQFAVHMLDGDHFYLADEPSLFAALRPVLAR